MKYTPICVLSRWFHDIKGHSNHKLQRGLRHFLSFKYRYHRGDTCQYLFTIIVCAKEIYLLFTVIDVRFYVLHFAYLLLSLLSALTQNVYQNSGDRSVCICKIDTVLQIVQT